MTPSPDNAWQAVEPDGRVRVLPAACIALRLDASICRSCVNVCPVDCIGIDAEKFSVNTHCIGCGLCAAACPTGALIVKGIQDFDALESMPGNQPLRVECLKVDPKIAGKDALRVACLGSLTATDWLALIGNADGGAVQAIDRGWCGQCEVAAKLRDRHPARVALDTVARWLAAAGVAAARRPELILAPLPAASMPRRIPSDAPTAPARRGFFLRLGGEAKRATGLDTGPAIPPPRILRNTPMPLPARERLFTVLQRLAGRLGQPLLAAPFYTLDVADTCANHAVCAGVCPTQALTRYVEADCAGIAFDAVRCIACGKCAAACPTHALTLRSADTPPAAGAPLRMTQHPRRTCAACQQAYFGAADSECCPACRRNRDMAAALFVRL